MNPKSFPSIVLLLTSAVILLLAPTVHSGCVNFEASWQAPSGPDSDKLNAKLWISSGDINSPDCWADQIPVDSNGPNPWATLTCNSGYQGSFDTIGSWTVSYSGPDGVPYLFDSTWYDESQMWYACTLDCSASGCFVPI